MCEDHGGHWFVVGCVFSQAGCSSGSVGSGGCKPYEGGGTSLLSQVC